MAAGSIHEINNDHCFCRDLSPEGLLSGVQERELEVEDLGSRPGSS